MFKEIQDWIVLFLIRRRGFVTGLKTILHCFKKSIKRKTKTNPRLFPARVFPRFRQCACCMLLWGGHGGLRCCGVDYFFDAVLWWRTIGIAVLRWSQSLRFTMFVASNRRCSVKWTISGVAVYPSTTTMAKHGTLPEFICQPQLLLNQWMTADHPVLYKMKHN